MFEREIQFIYDFNSNKVQKVGNYISLEQLRKVEIHPAILQYIVGEIDFLVFEDRQKLLKDSLFDYTIPTASNYLKLIGEEVKKNKRFSINYIDKLIQHSSSFIVSYLCKPNWSLAKFIFEDEIEKSTAEVIQILNYLFYYPHLRKVIAGYFEKKKIKSVSITEFKELLEKINKAGLETNYPKIIDEAIDSIADFFNTGGFKKNLIPLKSVEYFLSDHNLSDHLTKLMGYYNDDSTQKCNVSEVKEFLKKILIEKTEYFEDAQKESDETFETVESSRDSFTEKDFSDSGSQVMLENSAEPAGSEPGIENKIDQNYCSSESNEIYETKSEEFSQEVISEEEEEIDSSKNRDEESFEEEEIIEVLGADSENPDSVEIGESVSKVIQSSQNELTNQNSEPNDTELLEIEKKDLSLFDAVANEQVANEIETDEGNQIGFEKEKKIDISEILNDKRMAKILDIVFDYDVEEFSNAIEKICKLQTQVDADLYIDAICTKAKLNKDSKEAKTFKSVISKFYL